MKVTLKLNDFGRKDAKGGDGTLTIEKEQGSHTTTPDGTYAVKWQWIADASSFTVSIPDARAGLRFEPSPVAGNVTRGASVFWCLECERDLTGVGNLTWLPGVFSKNS